MNRFILPFFIATLSLCAGAGAALDPDAEKAAREITDASIRARVKFLASDLLEGRGPATRGDDLAQAYIASELEEMGVLPGAPDGTYFQKVPLVGITSQAPTSTTFKSSKGTLSLKDSEDLIAVSGNQSTASQIDNAEIVFVGYGIVAPEYQWDDFKDVDVAGKVLLVMNNDPADDPALFEGKRRLYYGRWDYKYEQAAKKGAAGVIIIHTTPSAAYPWQVVQTSWAGERFELPSDATSKFQMAGWATEDACRQLATLGAKDLDQLRASAQKRDFRPVPLGVNFSITLKNTIRKTQSANVIGKITGSDTTRSKEAVIYTAHHDHLGMKEDAKAGEDAIYNGALDNASGVAAILSVAKAFTKLPKPVARSVYFAFVAAEEQGLLGSEYLAKHPPLPPKRMAANINVDGVGIFGKSKDIGFIGLGKSSLDQVVIEVATAQGRVVKGDPTPDAGAFYRSDQFNFAKIGVPATFLEAGEEIIGKPAGFGRTQNEIFIKKNYHQPSDEYNDTWNFAGAVEDAQLSFHVGVAVGNAKDMPVWNKGDEFEATRLKALKELN